MGAVVENCFRTLPQVLNSNHWPISQSSVLELPDALSPAVGLFNQFYSQAHQSRRLNWVRAADAYRGCLEHRLHSPLCQVHSHGICTIMMETRRKYELTMSTHQACILLQFNAAPVVSIPVWPKRATVCAHFSAVPEVGGAGPARKIANVGGRFEQSCRAAAKPKTCSGLLRWYNPCAPQH